METHASASSSVMGYDNTTVVKHRLFKSVAVVSAFFSLGLSTASLGPTLVSLEILLDTNTQHISLALVCGFVGFMVGAVVSGQIYGRINKELMFMLSLFGVAVTTAVIPYSGYLAVFAVVNAIRGFCQAIADSGANPYLLDLWEGHRSRTWLLQALHTMWSVGSMISPFIIKPFLVDISSAEQGNSTMNGTLLASTENTTMASSDSDLKERVEPVKIAFVILGALNMITVLIFLVLFFMSNPSFYDRSYKIKSSKDDAKLKEADAKDKKRFRIVLLLFMFFFYLFYLWLEGIPGSFLAMFLVRGLGWPNESGALVTSLFWGSFCIARIIGSAMSAVMSALQMIILDLALVSAGCVLLMFSEYHPSIVWVSSATIGAGLASVFASAILWTGEYIEITGVASSVFFAGVSAGKISGAFLTGFLFDKVGHMAMVYNLLASSVLFNAIFISANVYVKKCCPSQQTKTFEMMEIKPECKGFIESNSETEKS